MNDVRRFYQKLTGFLNLKIQDKHDVIDWYDNLPRPAAVDETVMSEIQERTKSRLLLTIKKERKLLPMRTIFAWTTAAAAVIVLGYFGLRNNSQAEIASTTLLANVSPAKDRAIIVLDNGQEIDLDKLGTNQAIQVGQSIITKDAQGQVSYSDARTGKEQIQINSLRVPKASTYQLTLIDGTRVMLNADSKLTYPSSFGTGDRVVQLTGEAYFEVTKTSNKSRFIVESNNQTVQVFGTKFNVKSYPQDTHALTTLAEGSVKVNDKNQSDRNVFLKPNQQTALSLTELKVRSVDIEDVLGWTNGQFCFNGSNTVEVLEEIARWYDIDIKYERRANAVQYEGKLPRNLSLDRLIQLLNYAEIKTTALIGKDKRINLIIT